MHDDIIDRDVVRWGGPNISGHYLKVFAKKYEPQEARHYADSWALLAGDLCLGLSLEALSASGFAHNRIAKATRLVQQSLFRMIGGELMDVAAPVYGLPIDSPDEDHFTRLYASKTSVYSFCMPLRLGALLAGAGVTSDRQLEAFGYHIGIAFQLKDDILGVFGDESKTGKSTLSDLREGKRTMLISLGYKAANSRQKQVLNRVLGNPKASYKDLKLVQDILKTTGALGRTQSAMQRHCDEARNILLRSGFPMSLNAYLADLLAFSVKRSS
jgi:geranylgeranyl diphosphate synthase type II